MFLKIVFLLKYLLQKIYELRLDRNLIKYFGAIFQLLHWNSLNYYWSNS